MYWSYGVVYGACGSAGWAHSEGCAGVLVKLPGGYGCCVGVVGGAGIV